MFYLEKFIMLNSEGYRKIAQKNNAGIEDSVSRENERKLMLGCRSKL